MSPSHNPESPTEEGEDKNSDNVGSFVAARSSRASTFFRLDGLYLTEASVNFQVSCQCNAQAMKT